VERDPEDVIDQREEDRILSGLEQEHKDGHHEDVVFVQCPLCASEKG